MARGELVFHRGSEDLIRVRLDRAETCIGSHPTNDVVVPDPAIPAVAAVLVDRGASRYKLRDLTSGVLKLDGDEIDADEMELEDGSRIELGSFVLELRLRTDDQPAFRHTTILEGPNKALARAFIRYDGQEHELALERPFNIGSDSDNDLELTDEFVSSFHCRISNEGGRWTLVDLASTNGTRVNGLRVGEAELPGRATIEVGRVRVEFDGAASRTDDDVEIFGGMIASSSKMRRVFEVVRRWARADAPVLIIGDSGCGKELVARALHDEGPRAASPFLALNCGALAGALIESELFGHVRGAFTGADRDRKGAFESAEEGTLFLDEIGELPLELQPKLLRALEARTIRRVGGAQEVPFSARIVAATHRNLKDLVDEGSFREDLFHRLYVLNVLVPRLHERPEDVLPIARHFAKVLSPANRPMSLTSEAERALTRYRWPGNVRELKNVILRAILLSDGDSVDADALEFSEAAFSRDVDAHRHVRSADELDRQRIVRVLDSCAGNRAEAARQLGLSKSTFHDRLRRLGLPAKFERR
ncbi:MAG: sigma 54-dependent Fis family transcriptional regulator [Deltaproteobacteria bacterium]|nr:sigma 54-dependent Fis family transcriptional regulator [Deltaproteobacteria bacterium]